jgi:D-serine deaminase-like pyridoxal phosphate-dependent protein
MNSQYLIQDTTAIFSPALLFYKDLIRRNILHALGIAGAPSRLRPHVKTHKTREIVRMELDAGITKHKCATLAEAEMLASCGVPDVLVAYNIVGPNASRLVSLLRKYPACQFSVTADDPCVVRSLSESLTSAGRSLDIVLDVDVGMHRTGIAPGEQAVALYELIDRLPGLKPAGVQAYDGHIHHESLAERTQIVNLGFESLRELVAKLQKKGLPVPRLVVGGTPTFSIYARMDVPGLECSPGTCFLHDHGYGTRYADLAGFIPAALLLTRVISRPTATHVTLDLGYKAVASDPPAGKRCFLLNVPDYEPVLQSEEHLVVTTPKAAHFRPGDEVYAVPTHICPTCAMHRQAFVVENAQVSEAWDIVGRDRVLTV